MSECEATQFNWRTANCACDNGYFGEDCSLSEAALRLKRQSREIVANALFELVEVQDVSQ